MRRKSGSPRRWPRSRAARDQQARRPSAAADAAAELRAAATEPRVARFYEARGWAPAWTTRAAALTPRSARPSGTGSTRRPSSAAVARRRAPAARDAALSHAALAYAEALARGRTDPARLHDALHACRAPIPTSPPASPARSQRRPRRLAGRPRPAGRGISALSEAYVEAAGRSPRRRAGRRRRWSSAPARWRSISSGGAGSSARRRRPGSTSTPAPRR